MTSTDPASSLSSGLGWCSAAIAAAAIGLALGNADSARNWAEGLRPSPWTQPIRDAAEHWADFTKTTRLSLVRDEVRGTWEHRHDLAWKVPTQKRTALATRS
jgi:hypothetical protein